MRIDVGVLGAVALCRILVPDALPHAVLAPDHPAIARSLDAGALYVLDNKHEAQQQASVVDGVENTVDVPF